MSSSNDERLCAALMTPRGRGAVATIAVAGHRAAAAVAPLIRAANGVALAQQPIGRVVFGHFALANNGAMISAVAGGSTTTPASDVAAFADRSPISERKDQAVDAGEQVVVCRVSPTRLEIHCHGGFAAPDALLQSLSRQGCEIVDWPSLLEASESDSIAAAARRALVEARTEHAAMILLDQLNGALRRRLRRIVSLLEECSTASLGERDSQSAAENESDECALHDKANSDNPKTAAAEMLARLAALATLGRRLIQPWRIVIAGPPNVGKSSLLNALVGYERAIAHDAPGTTRDVISTNTAIDGWPVELSDTAGLRDAPGAIERTGIAFAERELKAADLVLLVFDRSVAWSDSDQGLFDRVTAMIPREKVVVTHSKRDLPAAATLTRPAGIEVSATARTGIEELLAVVARRLVPIPPRPAEATPFTEEQAAAVFAAQAACERDEFKVASEILQSLLAR